MTTTALRRPTAARLRRIEPAAIGAVVFREATLFRRYWRSTTFSSVVEPTIYLLAFGFGFGSLVAQVARYDYIDFVGTGIVATAGSGSGHWLAILVSVVASTVLAMAVTGLVLRGIGEEKGKRDD